MDSSITKSDVLLGIAVTSEVNIDIAKMPLENGNAYYGVLYIIAHILIYGCVPETYIYIHARVRGHATYVRTTIFNSNNVFTCICMGVNMDSDTSN